RTPTAKANGRGGVRLTAITIHNLNPRRNSRWFHRRTHERLLDAALGGSQFARRRLLYRGQRPQWRMGLLLPAGEIPPGHRPLQTHPADPVEAGTRNP